MDLAYKCIGTGVYAVWNLSYQAGGACIEAKLGQLGADCILDFVLDCMERAHCFLTLHEWWRKRRRVSSERVRVCVCECERARGRLVRSRWHVKRAICGHAYKSCIFCMSKGALVTDVLGDERVMVDGAASFALAWVQVLKGMVWWRGLPPR